MSSMLIGDYHLLDHLLSPTGHLQQTNFLFTRYGPLLYKKATYSISLFCQRCRPPDESVFTQRCGFGNKTKQLRLIRPSRVRKLATRVSNSLPTHQNQAIFFRLDQVKNITSARGRQPHREGGVNDYEMQIIPINEILEC